LYKATKAQQRLRHVLGAVEAVGSEEIGNAAIEALDHAVGLRCAGLGQAVFYAQRLTEPIKLMLPARFTRFAGKQASGELLAVVRR